MNEEREGGKKIYGVTGARIEKAKVDRKGLEPARDEEERERKAIQNKEERRTS